MYIYLQTFTLLLTFSLFLRLTQEPGFTIAMPSAEPVPQPTLEGLDDYQRITEDCEFDFGFGIFISASMISNHIYSERYRPI